MGGGFESRPGKSSLVHEGGTSSAAPVGPGKRTLTEQLPLQPPGRPSVRPVGAEPEPAQSVQRAPGEPDDGHVAASAAGSQPRVGMTPAAASFEPAEQTDATITDTTRVESNTILHAEEIFVWRRSRISANGRSARARVLRRTSPNDFIVLRERSISGALRYPERTMYRRR